MRQIREVLRLRHELRRSHREIADAVGISAGSVGDYLKRSVSAGLTFEAAQQMDDTELERLLFRRPERNTPGPKAPIDLEWVHRELRRTGVTLQLLWLEYQQGVKQAGDTRPYQYSQFCQLYRDFVRRLHPSMRQVHQAGEKAFVDYSGKKPVVVDPSTGEAVPVELFVIVLGASNYTYAEATRTQQLPDFVGSHVRAFEYFGCVPHVLVPDRLKSGVTGTDRYDPDPNPTYLELAQHYGTCIIPARSRKPKDKAKVENGVLVAQRWILARLRNRTFFSLDELNEAIWELLEDLNRRPFKKLEGCRRSAFESIDRPAMLALPNTRYELAQWKRATVNIDYHVDFDDRLYSVPCSLIGETVDIRATATTVEVLHGGPRVASHRRSYGPKGTAVTCEEHRPKNHRDYGKWPPERLVNWARSIGPHSADVIARILGAYAHPEKGYRSCLGLIRVAKRYGNARMESACQRALLLGVPTRKCVEAILKNGLDRLPPAEESAAAPVIHENIRGAEYFVREGDNCVSTETLSSSVDSALKASSTSTQRPITQQLQLPHTASKEAGADSDTKKYDTGLRTVNRIGMLPDNAVFLDADAGGYTN